MSITKPQAEIIADMVPQWEKAMDEIVDALTPCAADFCRHESREHKDSCGCLHPGCECDTFIASSTPALQGEKCAHAPEIPEDLKEMYDCCVKLMETREDYGFLPSTPFVLIERIALVESTLARERESRKQAEAALRKAEEAMLSGNQMDGLGERYAIDGAPLIEALTSIRVYFRPIPQEPAEPESGK